MQLRFV